MHGSLSRMRKEPWSPRPTEFAVRQRGPQLAPRATLREGERSGEARSQGPRVFAGREWRLEKQVAVAALMGESVPSYIPEIQSHRKARQAM